jgi:ankyrin repeat protein
MIKHLLDRGANINATDGEGFTALSVAVMGEDTMFVNELLARGARPLVGKQSAIYVAIWWWRAGHVQKTFNEFADSEI